MITKSHHELRLLNSFVSIVGSHLANINVPTKVKSFHWCRNFVSPCISGNAKRQKSLASARNCASPLPTSKKKTPKWNDDVWKFGPLRS